MVLVLYLDQILHLIREQGPAPKPSLMKFLNPIVLLLVIGQANHILYKKLFLAKTRKKLKLRKTPLFKV